MSGGDYHREWCQLEDLAHMLCDEQHVRRRALGAQLLAASTLMYEVEWHDSRDTTGATDAKLEAAWATYTAAVPSFRGAVLLQAVQSAESTLDELRSAIEQAKETP